jgi:hypothetical protein
MRHWLVTKADILLTARYVLCFPVAWATPESWWSAIANACAAMFALPGRRKNQKTASEIRSILGAAASPISVETRLQHQHTAALIESMQHLRCYRPGGWSPKIELVGSVHIDHALKGGKGVILWVTDFIFSTLVTKMALHRAGCKAMHLSSPDHPLSETRFGRSVLNPIVTHLEERHLDQRIVADPEGLTGGLRTLLRRLKGNGIVSITVGNEARQTVQLPFLEGHIHLGKRRTETGGRLRSAHPAGFHPAARRRLLRDDSRAALGIFAGRISRRGGRGRHEALPGALRAGSAQGAAPLV